MLWDRAAHCHHGDPAKGDGCTAVDPAPNLTLGLYTYIHPTVALYLYSNIQPSVNVIKGSVHLN